MMGAKYRQNCLRDELAALTAPAIWERLTPGTEESPRTVTWEEEKLSKQKSTSSRATVVVDSGGTPRAVRRDTIFVRDSWVGSRLEDTLVVKESICSLVGGWNVVVMISFLI